MNRRLIGRALFVAACAAAAAGCGGSTGVGTTSGASANAGSGPTWRELSLSNPPLPRNSAGFAYDPATKTIVLSGGRHGCTQNAADYTDTWTFDGTAWRLQPAGTNPGMMASFSMAYDPGSAQMIALGVYSGCGVQTGMMTWDGSIWTSTPDGTTLPSPMLHRSLAFDGATNQMIAFGYAEQAGGGTPSPNPTGPQTWAYDGRSWTQLQPATSPPAMIDTSMAYDPITRQLVLFGGAPFDPQSQTEGGPPVNSTWTFDGTTWSKLQTAGAPPPRVGGSMVYDDALGSIVLFGGAGSDPQGPLAGPATVLDDMWTFNGNSWSQLHPATVPSGRFFAQMTYNPTTQQIVLFGGALNTSSDANDTWTYGAR